MCASTHAPHIGCFSAILVILVSTSNVYLEPSSGGTHECPRQGSAITEAGSSDLQVAEDR